MQIQKYLPRVNAPSATWKPCSGDIPISPDGRSSSWTKASTLLSYNPKTKLFADTGLQPKGKFDDLPGYESAEVNVKSYDGVLVR